MSGARAIRFGDFEELGLEELEEHSRIPEKASDTGDDLRAAFLSLSTPAGLAALLECQRDELMSLLSAKSAEKYSTFFIQKRRGGRRTIEAPNPALKSVQRRLSSILYAVHRPRPSAHGFRRHRGIGTNANCHVGKQHVGNLDLENFFGSINFGRVFGLFLAKPYALPRPVATVLAQICCHKNALPQGAPTSPIVANMVANSLDRDLECLAARYRCRYSRYADDLTFSTDLESFPRALLEPKGEGQIAAIVGPALAESLLRQGFRPNPKKVHLASRRVRQEVTGLVVNEKVNIKREFIRQVRAMTHALGKFGDEAATEMHYEEFSTKQYARGGRPMLSHIVKGKLEFVRSTIGADNPVYLTLVERYRQAIEPPPTSRRA